MQDIVQEDYLNRSTTGRTHGIISDFATDGCAWLATVHMFHAAPRRHLMPKRWYPAALINCHEL